MSDVRMPRVIPIAWTTFDAPAARFYTGWSTDADDGQALVEFAGRACYQSWDKPNPATSTNAGYLAHIIDVGHLSVLEHASVTFYIGGVSRALTHELIRHRHLSFSQLSQRYVDEGDVEMVVPQVYVGDEVIGDALERYGREAKELYRALVQSGEDHGLTRKQSREAARAVLPNMTDTKIVVTGNYRAWRHFIDMRATVNADAEIREVAVEVCRQLKGLAPNAFADYTIHELPDGRRIADTPAREVS